MLLNKAPLASRLLVALLYDSPADTQWEGFQVMVRISSMASHLNTKPDRLKEAFRLLLEAGALDALEFHHGYAKAHIKLPVPLRRLLGV